MPRRIRGTLIVKEGDDVEFHAQRSTGLSAQEQVASCGQSKLYRTVGEKTQKMVAHLSIAADSPDPRADLMEQVEKLTRDMPTNATPRIKGKTLLRDDDVSIVTNKRDHLVQVTMRIDVQQYPNYISRLLTLMQRINQCFASNQISLAKLRK